VYGRSSNAASIDLGLVTSHEAQPKHFAERTVVASQRGGDLAAGASSRFGIVVAHPALLSDAQDLTHPAGAIADKGAARLRPGPPQRRRCVPAIGFGEPSD